jgi:PAS domain S-box-containing protein
MISHRQKPAAPWLLVVLFIIIAASSILFGLFYYKGQKHRLLNDKEQELSAIADLKVRQIAQWRNERIRNAGLIGENIPLVKQLAGLMVSVKNKNHNNNASENLKFLTGNSEYKNVILIDLNGVVRAFYPQPDTLMAIHLKKMLPDLMKLHSGILTDLHETDKISTMNLDLIIPLINSWDGDSAVLGFLALRIEPNEILYPLVQTWPVPSKTAESILVRQEGDDVVFLNRLRFRKNSEIVWRRPAAEAKLPAAMAVRGIDGTTDGIDYRGASVVAAMKKVPGSSWYLVAKTDQNEVFMALNKQMTLVLIIIILVIATIGLLLGIIEWNENVRFYREKYEAEVDHLALRKHYDHILKYANDIIFLTDHNMVIIEANDRACEAYQRDRNEIIGFNVNKIWAPGTLRELEKEKKTLDDIGYTTFETTHIRKDGTTLPVEISARSVEIEGVKYYQSICRDITERKSAENTLRESEEKFRKIFEESPFSMAMTGKDLGIIKANSAFCRMLGYEEEELRSFTFRKFTHPDYVAADEIELMRLVAEEIPAYHTEKQYIKKDGSLIWGSTTISIIRSNNSEILYFLAMVEDITLRKKAETELEKSFSLIKATLESTADGILVVDNDGKIVQFNQKFVEMWGIAAEIMEFHDDDKAIQFVMDQLAAPDDFVTQIRQHYKDTELTTSDLLEFKDGRVFERFSQPQKIGGKSVGRVWSFRDITQRKKAEAELIAAKERAEESDRLKTAFLHNVSHEIRTPMNAIIGFSTLLNEPDTTDAERRQFIDIIFRSGSQLLSIINDIVDVANIESGQVKINIKEINLNSSMRSLNEQFSYNEKHELISIRLTTGLPDERSVILTDGTKLIQILSNLISNATKFTKEGEIDFGYELKDGSLEFWVRDTGIGIPNELHEKIFERFFQVDNLISRKFSGTGLGLSICKAYVGLLGGRIWVISRPGEGTMFRFTIPYCVPAEKEKK